MKKLVILAIFANVLATFAEVRYNAAGHKITKYNDEAEPDYYHTTEYFKITINWQGAVTTDGKTFTHSRKRTQCLLMLRTNEGVQTANWVYNVGGDVVYEKASFQSFVAVNMADGSKNGYFTVDCKVGGRGTGIPDATVRICGELKLARYELMDCWKSVSGDGYAVGWSDGGRVSDLVENASWCAPSNAVLPLRGTVTIAPFLYLTERQKLNFAPKK